MAKIIAQDEPLTITTSKRTWRVTIETAEGTDYTLTAHRELVRKAGGETIARDQNAGTVTCALSAVAARELTLESGKVVTPAEVAEALVLLIEALEDEAEGS